MKTSTLKKAVLSTRTFALSALVATSFSVNAQEEATEEPAEESAPLSISGTVDTYLRTAIGASDGSDAPGSSFAGGDGFNLGMANVILAKEGAKSGFVADLVFGPRGDAAVFNDAGSNFAIVNQLYGYWNAHDKVTLTLGNFNTFLGYEVISPAANFNYSTSYMFSYGPFSHTGLKADFALTDELSAMVSVMNPTDMTSWNGNINTPSFGFQLGYANDAGGAWLNILTGDQDGSLPDFESDTTDMIGSGSGGNYFQVDLTTGWNLTDELYLGFNATQAMYADADIITTDGGTGQKEATSDTSSSSFMGAALYVQYSLSDAFAIGIRGEYFSDTRNMNIIGDPANFSGYNPAPTNGVYGTSKPTYSDAASIIDFTISAPYSVGDLTLIPEFRVDSASDDIFLDKDGNGTSTLMSVLLAAVYSF